MEKNNSAQSLKDIIENKKFVIPMYQRNYKWNTTVATKLVQDIINCYNHSKDNRQNSQKSLGLLTLYQEQENDDKFYVVDGQQRFTTLTILLAVLQSQTNINLSFERDKEDDKKRQNAIFKEATDECTDVNRIKRNKEAISKIIEENIKNEELDFANFVLENVIMLCSVVNELPVEEFMNLNAYKTAFSISDHIRANLISLNSFYKDEMNNGENAPILARCLSKNTYKTAVAVLYNNIQEKLYKSQEVKGTYKSLYDLLKEPKEKVIDPKIESRINIIFSGMLKDGATNYDSGEITENFDYWIKMLQKLAYVNKLLDELESELKQEEFHSFKQIDDYQKMTNKSFIIEVFDGINRLDQGWDSKTLAKEIQKYSNIDSVLIRCLSQDSQKLANRYLEAFVYSTVNEETIKRADNEGWKKVKLPQMSMEEVIQEISGCGRYIVDRYEREHREDLDTTITIPPVIDLEDRENINFGGKLNDDEVSGDTITVGKLFNHNICIPVIQRDYCMGARITGKNDFLAFLVKGFYEKQKELTASTILISVSNDNDKNIYIFDGQQRTFTLYNILKYCEEENENVKSYSFIGRNDNATTKCGSPYSEQAVKKLETVLQEFNKIDKATFAKYIREKVSLKVKIVDNVSGAEQFFMDINGGVALKKYEIFKAMLCSKLSELGKCDVVRKIENKWLDFFYKYRKNYLKASDIASDESDTEELLEMRFIEFICRFVYRMKHFGAKYEDIWTENDDGEYSKNDDGTYGVIGDEEELLSFDEIESKGEMVAKLSYIAKLTKDDITIIDKIMEYISKECSVDCDHNATIELISLPMDTNSKGECVVIRRLIQKGNKKAVLNNQAYYIKRFIWSLLDVNREYLKDYYRYKNVGDLIKIYDDDQIMRDILLNVLDSNEVKGDAYPYQLFDSKINIFYTGYNNDNNNKQYNSYNTWSIGKHLIEEKYVKETPAYYYSKLNDNSKNTVRLQYLQEKAENVIQPYPKQLFFALVKKNMSNQIKFEDGEGSNICLVNNLDNYCCTNRTEAYCLVYIGDNIIQVE